MSSGLEKLPTAAVTHPAQDDVFEEEAPPRSKAAEAKAARWKKAEAQGLSQVQFKAMERIRREKLEGLREMRERFESAAARAQDKLPGKQQRSARGEEARKAARAAYVRDILPLQAQRKAAATKEEKAAIDADIAARMAVRDARLKAIDKEYGKVVKATEVEKSKREREAQYERDTAKWIRGFEGIVKCEVTGTCRCLRRGDPKREDPTWDVIMRDIAGGPSSQVGSLPFLRPANCACPAKTRCCRVDKEYRHRGAPVEPMHRGKYPVLGPERTIKKLKGLDTFQERLYGHGMYDPETGLGYLEEAEAKEVLEFAEAHGASPEEAAAYGLEVAAGKVDHEEVVRAVTRSMNRRARLGLPTGLGDEMCTEDPGAAAPTMNPPRDEVEAYFWMENSRPHRERAQVSDALRELVREHRDVALERQARDRAGAGAGAGTGAGTGTDAAFDDGSMDFLNYLVASYDLDMSTDTDTWFAGTAKPDGGEALSPEELTAVRAAVSRIVRGISDARLGTEVDLVTGYLVFSDPSVLLGSVLDRIEYIADRLPTSEWSDIGKWSVDAAAQARADALRHRLAESVDGVLQTLSRAGPLGYPKAVRASTAAIHELATAIQTDVARRARSALDLQLALAAEDLDRALEQEAEVSHAAIDALLESGGVDTTGSYEGALVDHLRYVQALLLSPEWEAVFKPVDADVLSRLRALQGPYTGSLLGWRPVEHDVGGPARVRPGPDGMGAFEAGGGVGTDGGGGGVGIGGMKTDSGKAKPRSREGPRPPLPGPVVKSEGSGSRPTAAPPSAKEASSAESKPKPKPKPKPQPKPPKPQPQPAKPKKTLRKMTQQ